MRLAELKKSSKKTIAAPFDPVEDARQSLEWEKEHGIKALPNGTLQLFVPRKIERFRTRKEKEDYLLRAKAKYVYDDEGNLMPQYKAWVNAVEESFIPEGAPIIAGGAKPKTQRRKTIRCIVVD